MEKITDFFKELKERINNPLISSFIISWIFINWKITIGLIFYKNTDFINDGYFSYFDLITRNSELWRALWLPLIIATGYTFIFPFLRNVILAFQSWIKSWGSVWNLRFAKDGKISTSKYIGLRKIYEERTVFLEEVIEKESKLVEENAELKTNNLKLLDEKNNLHEVLSKWQNANNPSILNGNWEFSHNVFLTDEEVPERIFIHNGVIEYLDRLSGSSSLKKQIDAFFYNPESGDLSFITNEMPNSAYIEYYKLKAVKDLKILRGKNNSLEEVEFKRIR